MAIRSDGSLAAWGNNQFGQLNVPSGTFSAISSGGFFSVGLRSDGTLATWGKNDYGQLNAPSGVFTAVSCGLSWAMALRPDGTIAAWGRDNHGQVATAPTGHYSAISAGGFFGVAIEAVPGPGGVAVLGAFGVMAGRRR